MSRCKKGWILVPEEETGKIRYISKTEEEYPPQLLPLERMPAGLYLAGRFPDPCKKSVAIVGARACTAYGRSEAARFARDLAGAGVQIISGMAYGVDRCAHEGALEVQGETFAVLGCGADVCYPSENIRLYGEIAKKGGVISEYLPGTPPAPWHFPVRNRIISGLADLVLVIEARLRSGSLITADYALEQGKAVWAVPGKNADPLSQGCNRLIAQGAGIALSPECILEELGICTDNTGKASRGRELPGGWKNRELSEKILILIRTEEKTVQELRDATGAEVSDLSEALMRLCLYGYAREVMMGYYGAV